MCRVYRALRLLQLVTVEMHRNLSEISHIPPNIRTVFGQRWKRHRTRASATGILCMFIISYTRLWASHSTVTSSKWVSNPATVDRSSARRCVSMHAMCRAFSEKHSVTRNTSSSATGDTATVVSGSRSTSRACTISTFACTMSPNRVSMLARVTMLDVVATGQIEFICTGKRNIVQCVVY